MARIRTIKPEFWTSAQVLECSTNARLLFLGLWNFADDAGRHPYSPKQCKAEVFPADDFSLDQVEAMLAELEHNGLIRHYAHDGKDFFYITGWHHQRIDKPQKPKYPDPFHEHSKNDPRTFPPDRKGKDTKGKEDKDRARPRQSFKKPTVEEVRAYCEERGNRVDPEAFVAHYESNGWKVGKNPMKSWQSAVITWEKRDETNQRNGSGRTYESPAERRQRELDEHLARTEGRESLETTPRTVRGQVLEGVRHDPE